MGRRYHRRRTGSKDKYSIEQTMINTPNSSAWTLLPAVGIADATRQFSIPILAPSTTQGMRKIKHFTLTFTCNVDDQPFAYALVYVPEGYEPQRLNLPTGGNAMPMYPANQFVISQGILDFSGGPLRIRSPLSRNLNSGDSIYLILSTYDGVAGAIMSTIKYAITLQ